MVAEYFYVVRPEINDLCLERCSEKLIKTWKGWISRDRIVYHFVGENIFTCFAMLRVFCFSWGFFFFPNYRQGLRYPRNVLVSVSVKDHICFRALNIFVSHIMIAHSCLWKPRCIKFIPKQKLIIRGVFFVVFVFYVTERKTKSLIYFYFRPIFGLCFKFD